MQNSEFRIQNVEKRRDIYARSFDFACRIVRLHAHLGNRARWLRPIATQLLRSGTSLGANLEEAHAAQSRADFVAKCRIALKEARESHYWLRLLSASEVVSLERIGPLVSEADEIVAILTTIVKNTTTARSS